jgi:perosamine synthetase
MNHPEAVPLAEPDLRGNEAIYLQRCLESGWISSIGPFVSDFERRLADFVGVPHALTTGNGTVALHLALAALRIGPGDEVIVPDLTFAATANAVLYCGATPVLVDVSPDDWNLDPAQVAAAISPRTKAILPVHLYGHPCRLDEILAIARAAGVYVVEDAAESLGSRYKGRPSGSHGDISCFSFYGNKLITTGEGGACLTSNPALHERMSFLRDHGMNKKRRYWHEEVGFNYRITSLQAAIGLAQMERIEELLAAKRRNAELYRRGLAELGLEMSGELPGQYSSFWMFNLQLPENVDRADLMLKLEARGIATRSVFYPLHQMPPYQRFVRPGQSFPVSDRLSARGLSLPSATTLRPEQIERVCAELRGLLGESSWATAKSERIMTS